MHWLSCRPVLERSTLLVRHKSLHPSRGLLRANHSTARIYQGIGFPVKEDLPSIEQTALRGPYWAPRKRITVRNGEEMHEQSSPRNFEDEVLPHLDAAYNLARWLTRNDPDAEDVVQ